ncbi:Transient receptor putative cation channel subfamily M member 2 [Crenichthys baileyi]|uniref:Transient receptor putative cation channel subfamily M member 2 n=1 Tax=Crenichthys baileyi TaxID=28760 RepID=A0AAV9QWL7_9TELE
MMENSGSVSERESGFSAYADWIRSSELEVTWEGGHEKFFKVQRTFQDPLREDRAEVQKDAGRDLFLWAVLQNNKELAEIAWEQYKDSMSAALGASKILKKMAEEGSDADEAQDMLELASHCENHAIGVFNKCHNSDEEQAQKLLVQKSHLGGETTCLRLALEADDKNFVAQSGVAGF